MAEDRKDDPLQVRGSKARASVTINSAHCPIGKPPTPVPNAGIARERVPSSSATSRVRLVAWEMSSAEVCRS
jgi:hypothetical protein